MLANARAAVVTLLFFTALTGLAYPLAITGLVQVASPGGATGSLIAKDGRVVGSALIGQNFESDRYFHGRPSATSAPDPNDSTKVVDAPYNAAASAGSNLGPLSKKLLDRVAEDVAALRKDGATVIPADAVTTSASGLDPHISPAFAELQVERVARARGAPVERVRSIVDRQIERSLFGVIGEPRVNVLLLNISLDAALGPNG
jgi:K+-transporting ATPase ATPase C chain